MLSSCMFLPYCKHQFILYLSRWWVLFINPHCLIQCLAQNMYLTHAHAWCVYSHYSDSILVWSQRFILNTQINNCGFSMTSQTSELKKIQSPSTPFSSWNRMRRHSVFFSALLLQTSVLFTIHLVSYSFKK